jgi:hypothetical protein
MKHVREGCPILFSATACSEKRSKLRGTYIISRWVSRSERLSRDASHFVVDILYVAGSIGQKPVTATMRRNVAAWQITRKTAGFIWILFYTNVLTFIF